MRRLVLDLSALVAMPRQAFASLTGRSEFLLAEKALEELFTWKPREKAPWSNARARAHAQLTKLDGFRVLHPRDPFRFEVEEGRASSSCQYEVTSIVAPSADEMKAMRANAKKMATLWEYKHPSIHEDTYRTLRRLSADGDLFPCISGFLTSERGRIVIRSDAIESSQWMATKHNWTVSGSFSPGCNWLTYGVSAVKCASILYKYARHGDKAPGKPANASYDLTYIAHMAICDGLLASDEVSGLLPLAWACWPEKRQNIWRYDQETGKIVRYDPPWEK